MLSAGMRLGPYEILSHLGSGGMGTVYQARDTRLNRIVAVKLLLPRLANNPEFLRRFDREARAISGLNHPHICALYDVGHENGLSYLVMEYLSGETLSDRLSRAGPLPFDEVRTYGIQIASALKDAHDRNIVHRDIKPGNVMLTRWGAKLMDFGLATTFETRKNERADTAQPADSHLSVGKLSLFRSRLSRALGRAALPASVTESTVTMTAVGRIGTLPYMAPEQLSGKETDWRTDVFAFGALLYEMAVGRRAFTGSCETDIVNSILHRHPSPVSAFQPLASTEFDRIVHTCLAKDREQRWRTTSELLVKLTRESMGQRERILKTMVAELGGRSWFWQERDRRAAGRTAVQKDEDKRRDYATWVFLSLGVRPRNLVRTAESNRRCRSGPQGVDL